MRSKPTKTMVWEAFKALKPYGFKVWNFSDNRALRKAQAGWVDYVILSNRILALIECKIGEDTLSSNQTDTKSLLEHFIMDCPETHCKRVRYYIVNEDNYLDIRDRILEA